MFTIDNLKTQLLIDVGASLLLHLVKHGIYQSTAYKSERNIHGENASSYLFNQFAQNLATARQFDFTGTEQAFRLSETGNMEHIFVCSDCQTLLCDGYYYLTSFFARTST